eukprot:2155578-Pyramimonas_sp.AAC.1
MGGLNNATDPFRQQHTVVGPAELDFVFQGLVPVDRDENLGLRNPSALNVATLKCRNKVDM